MHREGWSLEKNCASAIERTDELSKSSRALRQFGTSSPTSERKRQRICVQAETDMETMAETSGSQRQRRANKKNPKNQTKKPNPQKNNSKPKQVTTIRKKVPPKQHRNWTN